MLCNGIDGISVDYMNERYIISLLQRILDSCIISLF